MKYDSYIENINPSSELKDKIYTNVKKELVKKQITKRKRIKGTITAAACFALLIGTVSVINNTSKFDTQNTLINQSKNGSENFITITEEGNSKSLPQELLINNAFYRQFSSNDVKNKLQKDNGNYVVKKSDIGDYVCDITSNNIYNVDTQKIENIENAEKNEFYNAKVYYYLPCNDLSNIIVKTVDKYYLFHIVNLNNSTDIKELFDLFSINKNNQIDSIEIWQDEIIDENITGFEGEKITGTTVKEVLKKTIKETNKISDIIKCFSLAKPIKNSNENDIYFDIHRNKINESMSETGQYRLVFKLSNGLSFEAWICKDSRYIQILESTYFELDFDNINTIIKTIE